MTKQDKVKNLLESVLFESNALLDKDVIAKNLIVKVKRAIEQGNLTDYDTLKAFVFGFISELEKAERQLDELKDGQGNDQGRAQANSIVYVLLNTPAYKRVLDQFYADSKFDLVRKISFANEMPSTKVQWSKNMDQPIHMHMNSVQKKGKVLKENDEYKIHGEYSILDPDRNKTIVTLLDKKDDKGLIMVKGGPYEGKKLTVGLKDLNIIHAHKDGEVYTTKDPEGHPTKVKLNYTDNVKSVGNITVLDGPYKGKSFNIELGKLSESKNHKKKVLKEEEIKSSDAFEVFDEIRKNLQDAQSALVINIPNKYQTLYQDDLASLYDEMASTINKVLNLTKKMKSELQQ